jgi:hypothetical protein
MNHSQLTPQAEHTQFTYLPRETLMNHSQLTLVALISVLLWGFAALLAPVAFAESQQEKSANWAKAEAKIEEHLKSIDPKMRYAEIKSERLSKYLPELRVFRAFERRWNEPVLFLVNQEGVIAGLTHEKGEISSFLRARKNIRVETPEDACELAMFFAELRGKAPFGASWRYTGEQREGGWEVEIKLTVNRIGRTYMQPPSCQIDIDQQHLFSDMKVDVTPKRFRESGIALLPVAFAESQQEKDSKWAKAEAKIEEHLKGIDPKMHYAEIKSERLSKYLPELRVFRAFERRWEESVLFLVNQDGEITGLTDDPEKRDISSFLRARKKIQIKTPEDACEFAKFFAELKGEVPSDADFKYTGEKHEGGWEVVISTIPTEPGQSTIDPPSCRIDIDEQHLFRDMNDNVRPQLKRLRDLIKSQRP